MTDTHSHPYMADSPEAATEIVRRGLSSGVDRIIMPNTDPSTIKPMRDLAAKFPANLRMAMGLHPTEINDNAAESLDTILNELKTNRADYIAIGEIGLDFYWDSTFKKQQLEIFDRQLSEAAAVGLPVIIHCREALDETLEVLRGHSGVPAVFHSFGGTLEDVERICRAGDYYFGINGIVTFKNSDLRNVLPTIPRDRLLLETDSPYLAPVPKRGKPNESAYLPFIASHIAESLGENLSAIIDRTSANSVRLFGF